MRNLDRFDVPSDVSRGSGSLKGESWNDGLDARRAFIAVGAIRFDSELKNVPQGSG